MPGGLHPPLEVISSWPKANYSNPITRSKAVLIVACVFGPVTIALVLARLWVRIRIQHNAGVDDWLMMAAIIPISGLTIIFPIATEIYGFNRHIWDVEPVYFVIQRKFVLVIETVFCLSSALVKISILMFHRRISSRVVSSNFRLVTRINIGSIVVYSIAFILAPIFGCNPISAFWDQVDPVKILGGYKYKCFNEGADVFAAGMISALQDLATAALPTLLYWNLQLPIRQKFALFGIFAIGYGVVAVGTVRVYFSWRMFYDTYDETWTGWDSCLWSMLELHVGAMCANAPALKVFFKYFLQIENPIRRTKPRSHQNGSKFNNQQNATSSKSCKSSATLKKLTLWKHSGGYHKRNYLSDPGTEILVENQGGVHVHNDIPIMCASMQSQKQNSISRSTESRNHLARNAAIEPDSDVDSDIEMGNWETHTPIKDEREHSVLDD